ncbi:MAG: LuxR family transcriptional regulator [Burkholderiaceae bacterium]|nr:LuxR family transcriptional regulator [Burkholderiaceae bacterium]
MVSLHNLLELFNAQNVDEWRTTLIHLGQQLGYEHSLFGIVGNRAIPLESAFLVSNYSDQWRTTYDKHRMHTVDPTVSHCLSSAMPIIWEPATFNGNDQNEFYEQARGYGLRSGITLPIHGSQGEFGVMSFVSSTADHALNRNSIEAQASLSLLRDYALESSRKFLQAQQSRQAVKLTEREQECLKWVATGKSSWEVSRILGRSEATINFHMANIMRKFDVQTRQLAVVKAIKQGLVAPA